MIVLRKAVLEDIPNIYEQLHLNYVKKYCKGEEEAQWEIHKKWYTFLINSSSYILYTIEDIGGKFLGSIKFEIENETSIICIFIAKELRGKGYSKIIIESSIDEMKFEKPEVSAVLAYILE
ncbi:MAG: GNAT family N-acetyltransferase, partial [Cetobacterium sp.]